MKIFVGNLSIMTTAKHLSALFIEFGKVFSVTITHDHPTGKSLGYGYVEMDAVPGKTAIRKLDNMNFMTRYLSINEVMG